MSSQLSLRDSLYLSDNPEETTFKYDESLPNLPLPSLEESIRKLLDTIKPIAIDQKAYKETERKALEFLRDKDVEELQALLKKRAEGEKNWLQSWWLEFAYLRSRKPLIPYSNMAAPLPIMTYWPVIAAGNPGLPQDVQCERAALSTFFQLSFWRMLREEKMRPMIHKGVPWSMSQFRYLFNTVRQPGDPVDTLKSWFRTAREGPPESLEVIVIHRGHLFAITAVTMHGQSTASILPAPLIQKQLEKIKTLCHGRPEGPGVGALTTGERLDWFEAREKLASICDTNRQILDRIDRALSVLVLDQNEPTNTSQILRHSMCGDPSNRWADKSIQSFCFQNGTFGASADHTPYDGFCTAIMTHYLITSVEGCQGKWNDALGQSTNSIWATYSEPEPLNFKLDTQVAHLIGEAREHFSKIAQTIDTLHETFDHFGKALLKEYRIHPEAFVQCALHATYHKQHKCMAPAYVTASTRKFYNGRTETCRSCFPEMQEFATLLSRDGASKPRLAYELLKKSADRFQILMSEASSGKGCDRHLMGLYLTAMFEGKKMPELFEDPLVLRTNNYILSTSCSGYWNVCGGVPPLVEEGYGCFYGIEDNSITFCCTAYKPCADTDLKLFYKNLVDTLITMQKVLLNSKL